MRIQIKQDLFRLLSTAMLVLLPGASTFASAEEVRELSGTRGPVTSADRAHSAELHPVRAFQRLSASQIHRIGPLGPGEITELEGDEGLESRTEGTRVGVIRSMTSPVGFLAPRTSPWDVAPAGPVGGMFESASDGRLTWTAGFASEGAGAIRLHLSNVVMPAGTLGFVYGASGETHGPYSFGEVAAGDFWTNAVFSEEIFLEIQFPGDSIDVSLISLTVSSVAHIQHVTFAPAGGQASASEALADCFTDLSCFEAVDFPALDDASKAIAQISYSKGTGVFLCTGGLLNTTAGTSIPYLLTANHCIDDAQTAASVEAYWDFRTSSCGGQAVSRSGLARTLGATLLATGSKQKGKTDFTLLRLNEQPPAGRFYLGWSTQKESVAAGVKLHRIAHPDGGPQSYSVHQVSSTPTPGSCDGLPTTSYIYSKNVVGATKGGSSGSPLFMKEGLKVVGQHFGRCGRNLDDACDVAENSAVDGSFAEAFTDVKSWLDPPKYVRCNTTALSLCLTGGKFRVQLLARDPRTGRGATGTAIPENDVFGYFSLPELTGQSENPEVFIKIVDGRSLNGKYWVFYGGLTDIEFQVEVTDMDTGVKKIYVKDAGGYCGDSDTSAF